MSEHANTALGPGPEFDLVRDLLARWGASASGVGDDAAVIDVPVDERLVVTIDSAVDDVHFRRAWLSAAEIGYRSATAAISDLAAMAARPLGLVIALVIPDDWRDDVGAIADGVGEAARAFECPIIGGDLSRGAALGITVTALGSAPEPVRRRAARPEDFVYVTGVLGGPRSALLSLERGEQPNAACRERFAHPRARVREARWLARQGAHAMIDISDGLSSELRHLAAASRVEVHVDLDRVPVMRGCALEDAVRGGEEYELVVASPHRIAVDEFARTFAVPLSEIGRVRDGTEVGVVALRGGQRVDLAWGHDHFSP